MSDFVDIPTTACRLQLDDEALQVSEPIEEGRKPRFRMRVNSGVPMQHAYFGTLAVDLQGIEVQHKHVPALLDHDPQRRVGYTTKLYVDEEEGLIAEGVMLSNDDASRVRSDSLDGFPWQASCYLVADAVTQVPDGEAFAVNGHEVVGPATVFDASQLREVTFCALGQDPNTSSDATLADGTATVRARLSVVKSSTMSESQEQTAQESAPVVDVEAVRLEAQRAESERVAYILECAADAQIELARSLIKDGSSERDAALALARDLRERDAQRAPVTQPQESTQPLSAAALAQEESPTYGDDEDGWQQQWTSDAKLRAEFGGNQAVWLSWNRNKHRCRSYGNNSQESNR